MDLHRTLISIPIQWTAPIENYVKRTINCPLTRANMNEPIVTIVPAGMMEIAVMQASNDCIHSVKYA